MNKTRRKALNALQDRITEMKALAEEAKGQLESIISDLESVNEEEQDAFDSKPESLQTDDARQPLDSMERAIELLQGLADAINADEIDDAFEQIEDAKGEA